MQQNKLKQISQYLQGKLGFFLPYVILIVFTVIIGILSKSPNTWLSGWDNLHPEFDLWMNIKRSLFAVWQEYQGLGLLGGMGHATALPREIFLAVLSLVVPVQLLRYVWTIGMLGIGAIGTYILLERYLLPNIIPHGSKKIIQIAGLVGAIFYLTNLATIQMFHVPFEAFSAHFGFLPLLINGFLLILEKPTKKRILLFTILNVISATQAYVPTLFVVYGILLGIISLVHLLQFRSLRILQHIILAGVLIFATNAYWMLPFTYFTVTRSQVNINAKINQMATEEVYLRNKAYGTLHDTIQLKGFWFDTFDFDPQKSQTTPLLSAWESHSERPLSIALSYIFFFLVCFGTVFLLAKRKQGSWWISVACLVSITMLTTDTYPFSWINELIREHIPLINQAFRFPFTKWSIVNSWLYSLLIGISLVYLLHWLQRIHAKKGAIIIALLITSGGLLYQSFPLLSGQLFYGPMQQKIPDDYVQLFQYMKQKPMGRIANLPQTTFWGWTYYRWGYTGSGFPWYGIEQPILDRAFDPWSGENENYYWELSLALYSKDPQRLQTVFNKYDVKYILLDESIISPSHNRALFTDEIKKLLSQDPLMIRDAKFGNVTIYERQTGSNNFVTVTQELPNISPMYTWGDADQASLDYGIYKTDPTDINDVTYLFRSLFSKRSVDEQSVQVNEEAEYISIQSSERNILNNNLSLSPESTPSSTLISENGNFSLQVNKAKALQFDAHTDPTLPMQANKVIPCGTSKDGKTKVEERASGLSNNLIFNSTNQRLCFSFAVPTLSHRSGYIVAVESKHISGRQLLFSVINQTAKHSELETFLPNDKDMNTTYFFVPPLGFDGLGYTFYFSNDSIGHDETINELGNVRIYEIPYQDMIGFKTGDASRVEQNTSISVTRPNSSYYQVEVPTDANTLTLYQSFHPGWKAYEVNSKLGEMFPFIFGKELKNHVLVNNWANGWEVNNLEFTRLPASTELQRGEPASTELQRGEPARQEIQNSELPRERTIVIFFLPQLLQWVGFGLLGVPLLLLL